MSPVEPAHPRTPQHLSVALSFMAPAALVALPALVLAYAPGEKNEAYEWTQHRVAGLVFAAAFASVLLGGCWRKGWPAALLFLTVLITVIATGIPGFHGLFGLAGGFVSLGYWSASRQSSPPLLEVVAVGFCSVLCFWAVAQLSWWQPFGITMAAWSNKIIFLAVTALLVWCLGQYARDEKPPEGLTRMTRGMDLLALAGFAAAALRTNSLNASLVGNLRFFHHWSVFVAPVDLVREGRVLLGEVPSQYGFLSTLVLAALPAEDSFTAIFWLNGALIWASAAILYFTLSAWLSHWHWKLVAALITVSGVAFIPGWAPDLTGPMPYPSVGAMRFIWVHVLLGFLLWRHLTGRERNTREPDWRTIWIGSGIWLAGVLWSVESAAYVTAAWFPAGALLAMNPAVEGAGRLARLRALLAGIGRSLLITSILLATALFTIGCIYWFGLGRMPEWSAYWEYAAAFSQGFGTSPIGPWDGVWVLLMLHAALLAAIVSLDPNRHRSATALIWAAWGALWAVSTYYVCRGDPNNITNLSPVLLLVVGLMGHALRATSARHLARPWLWLTVPAFFGAMLWLVLTNQSSLQSQIADYAVTPHVARLQPPHAPELNELITLCLARQPGRYVVVGHSMDEAMRFDPAPRPPAWLPVASPPLLAPLPPKRRYAYLDMYRREQGPGWLIAPVDQFRPSLRWFFDYMNSRYIAKITLRHKRWVAWYYVPNPALISPSGPKD